MGIASLVLGIVAIVCGLFASGFQWMGALGRKKTENKGIATAGLVCSIVGFSVSIIFYLACVACVTGLGSLIGSV